MTFIIVKNPTAPVQDVHVNGCHDLDRRLYENQPRRVLRGTNIDDLISEEVSRVNVEQDKDYSVNDLYKIYLCCRRR